MEIKSTINKRRWAGGCLCFLLVMFFSLQLNAQPQMGYTIKNGRMFVQIMKGIKEVALDSFLTQYGLEELDLKKFIKTNLADSLFKLGWKIEANSETGLVISKAFEPFGSIISSKDKIYFEQMTKPLFPAVNNGITYGVNRFRNKLPFVANDSVVTFFLRNRKEAKQVMLAGSFNNWIPTELSMQRTDSGWILPVKLGAGKYWYKFIVDGNWMGDYDNQLSENDGLGNINSVYYKPNTVFILNGFTDARKVFLAGSFNGWKEKDLLMNKTATGWTLPLYLAEGTHTYKFIIDGQWRADENNKEKLPDGHGDFNSVLRLGSPHLFKLNGFQNAKQVILTGSFNGWKEDELYMIKTAVGWELPYTLGPGNYEYKFKVDDKKMGDPANPVSSGFSGNSYLIIQPNHTFRLNGFGDAKKVFLAGDFNNWDPKAYSMRREGDDWIFPVHLSTGKHLYKFVVDDKWIIDPGNKLWEQNEYGNGNSVIWIEQ